MQQRRRRRADGGGRGGAADRRQHAVRDGGPSELRHGGLLPVVAVRLRARLRARRRQIIVNFRHYNAYVRGNRLEKFCAPINANAQKCRKIHIKCTAPKCSKGLTMRKMHPNALKCKICTTMIIKMHKNAIIFAPKCKLISPCSNMSREKLKRSYELAALYKQHREVNYPQSCTSYACGVKGRQRASQPANCCATT